MPVKIFTLPYNDEMENFDYNPVNVFCNGRQINSKTGGFFIRDGSPFWTVMIDYSTAKEEIPVKQNNPLSETERNLQEVLRSWRKEKADSLGYPPYLIFNNKQMFEIIKKLPKTKAELSLMNGFGKKKIESYGNEILKIIKPYLSKK